MLGWGLVVWEKQPVSNNKIIPNFSTLITGVFGSYIPIFTPLHTLNYLESVYKYIYTVIR